LSFGASNRPRGRDRSPGRGSKNQACSRLELGRVGADEARLNDAAFRTPLRNPVAEILQLGARVKVHNSTSVEIGFT